MTKHSSLWMVFRKFIYSYGNQINNLCSYKIVRAAKLSEKMQQVVQKESHKAVEGK